MRLTPSRRLGASLLGALTAVAAAALPTAPISAAPAERAASAGRAEFGRFVEDLWPDARAAGVSRPVFDDALKGVAPDPKIVALTKKQSEFVRPISDYVAGSVSAARLAKGREVEERWSSVFDKVERASGVPRHVVLAVWGMESGFGANTGGFSVVRSLATLAFVRYRGDFFRGELVQALKILQDGRIERAAMKGSWAGAMGQTQFMPSSYRDYALDGNGDGRVDIWTSAPDAIASTANYLKEKGWKAGLPWVVEVALPGSLDLRTQRQGFAAWAAAGVERLDGEAMPRSGEASLFLPMGVKGPAFLVTDNFEVIRTYNSSDAYALGVGYLANRMAGAGPIQRAWPSGESVIGGPERQEVQRRLTARGLYKGEADGRHGKITRDAIRQFQQSAGLVPDGYADLAVLKALRGER